MKALKWIMGTAVAVAALAGSAAMAADVTFMGFSYAEPQTKPSIEKILDGFKAESGLTVEPIGSAWGDMQKNLFLRARSHTLPDVAQLSERWLPTFKNFEGIVDFNEVFGKDYLEKTYAPDALALGQVDGKQLALPLMSGSIGMVANKAVLEQAGIDDLPRTVDEFRADLVAIRDKVPNSVPYTMATKNPNSILLDFMIWDWTFGGHVITPDGKVVVDSDAGRKALTFMVGLMKDRLAAPEIDRPDARRLVGQSASAFYIDAPQSRSFLRDFSGKGKDFDSAIAPMSVPVTEAGNNPASIQWGHILVQFAPNGASKDNPADKFLAYTASNAVQTAFPVEQSGLPATKAGRQDPAIANDPYLTAWAEANQQPLPNEVGVWPNGAALTQILGEEVQAALLGQKSPEDAIKSMQDRMSAEMEKAQKG